MKRTTIIFILILILILGGFFYGRAKVYHSQGDNLKKVTFQVEKGEGLSEIAKRLKEEDLISGKIFFYYYMQVNNLLSKVLPGEYELSGKLTIPEIATILTQKKENFIKLTFPEGWTMKQMSERLTENGLNGEGFLQLAKNPDEFRTEFVFLEDKKIKNLEGFLFPDTYFFAKDIEAKSIIFRMLNNFDNKLTAELRQKIVDQKRTISESIILASILEREVKTYEDRRLVAGIIENRLSVGQALQCDSTLAYILGDNKKQYTFVESRTETPYNTYINRGLPPGPIANPGISSINAALNPEDTNYNYFLTDLKTGNTIFSVNFEQHKANKIKYGL